MGDNFKTRDIKLFYTIFLTLLLPAIYGAVRINLLTNIPNSWGLNIASQLQWVNVSFEVIQEALILPLFFFIGTTIKNGKKTKEKIITSLTLTFIITSIFSLFIGINTGYLTKFMMQKTELIAPTIIYIRLELIAIILISLYKAIMVILVQLDQRKLILKFLFFEMILTIICDFIFIGNDSLGLHLGVNSIAYTNILVKTLLVILTLNKVLDYYSINMKELVKLINIPASKSWLKVGSISGLESFVRNFVFVIMIIKIVNQVGEQGTFWVTLNFLWGWILLPVLALGEVIKSEASKNKLLDLKRYFKFTIYIVLMWGISIPLWKFFLGSVMNLEPETLSKVLKLSYISILFYVVFAFNNIIDSYFYGIGKTELLLYQSLFVNITFYGTLYVLFKLNIFEPTLMKITIMFGTSMALDSIFTFFQYLRFKKRFKENEIVYKL